MVLYGAGHSDGPCGSSYDTVRKKSSSLYCSKNLIARSEHLWAYVKPSEKSG